MTPRAIAITCVASTLLGLLVVVPEPAAAEGTTSAINYQSFAGITTHSNPQIALDRTDNVVAMVYYNSAGAVLFSHSLDGGATWTNRATGLSPVGMNKLHVMAVSASTYLLLYTNNDATVVVQRTTDAGLAWAQLTTDAGICLVASCGGRFDATWVEDLGGGTFAYSQAGGVTSTRGLIIRYWSGSAWSTVFSRAHSDCCSTWSWQVSFDLDTDLQGGVIWYKYGASDFSRQTFANGASVSVVTVDDSFSALPSRQGPLASISGYGFICSGAPARLFALVPNGAAGFNSYPTTALCSALDTGGEPNLIADFTMDGNRLAFVTSESSNVPLTLWASCTGATTWTATQLEGSGGTYPANPAVVGVGAAKFLVAFRYGATGIAVVSNQVDNCTGSPSGGTGTTGTDSGQFSVPSIFCAELASDDFGYNYVEGTQRLNPQGFVNEGIDDGLLFEGDADNYDYLAKTFDPASASQALRVHFRIESIEGINPGNSNSVFRVGFSFQDHVDEGWDLGDEFHTLHSDAKGDGGDPDDLPSSGVFSHFIEVRFMEVNNERDWNAQVYLYWNGQRYSLGQAFEGDDPSVPTTYSFMVDVRSADPKYAVKRGDGTTISNGPLERALTAASFPQLPAIVISDLTGGNERLYSQWFVGYGTETALNYDAYTALDVEREFNGDDPSTASTCIYDLLGTAIPSGDSGASGPAATPEGKPETIIDLSSPENPANAPASTSTGVGLLTGFGIAPESQFLFGFAILGGFLVMARKKWDLEPETIKVGVLVIWIGLVWIGAWPVWSLIAAGVVGVMMFGKGVSKGLGG